MRLARTLARARQPGAARFIAEDVIEDTLERLAFLRKEVAKALVLGEWTGTLAAALRAQGAEVSGPEGLNLEAPHPIGGYDLIVVLGLLDAVKEENQVQVQGPQLIEFAFRTQFIKLPVKPVESFFLGQVVPNAFSDVALDRGQVCGELI